MNSKFHYDWIDQIFFNKHLLLKIDVNTLKSVKVVSIIIYLNAYEKNVGLSIFKIFS
jgi:hypothetical protein